MNRSNTLDVLNFFSSQVLEKMPPIPPTYFAFSNIRV